MAVLAVLLALQNPGYTELQLGPYRMTTSTALTLIVSFGLGALVGIIATIPSRIRSRRKIKHLKDRLRHTPEPHPSVVESEPEPYPHA